MWRIVSYLRLTGEEAKEQTRVRQNYLELELSRVIWIRFNDNRTLEPLADGIFYIGVAYRSLTGNIPTAGEKKVWNPGSLEINAASLETLQIWETYH